MLQTRPIPFLLFARLILGGLALSGCATRPSASIDPHEVHDPAESVNRGIFAANQFVDRNLLAPVSRVYRDNVPQSVRNSVGNFTRNLRHPLILTNDMLQGNVSRGWTTTQRFVVNSTAGVGGLFDVAASLGLEGHDADFGQTLGVWGVGPGPAVQLPLFGPSNLRDATGTAINFVANPLSFIPGGAMSTITLTGTVAGVVNNRADLLETTDALEASSLDLYATLRSAHAQRRARSVEEGIRGSRAGVNITMRQSPGE